MSSLEECVEKLSCPDESERAWAAEDLGCLNLAEAVPALLDRLRQEPSPAVRDAIFQALTGIDGDAAIEGSIRLLSGEEPWIRNQAVVVLRSKGARSLPFLKGAMRDGDKDMRKLVLDVLSAIQTSDAGEIYTAALADKDPNVVITAVENLGRLRAAGFRGVIEDLLQVDAHPMLTAACLEALVEIGHKSSLASVRRRFPDAAAVPGFLLGSWLKAIAALGSEREFAEVARLLPTCGPSLRPAILGALISIYPRCSLPEPDEDLLRALRAVAEDGDSSLCRYQAVRVLGFWTARQDVREFLVSCLRSPERLVRLGAAESLPAAQWPELEPTLAAHALEESDEEVLQALKPLNGRP